MSDVSGNGILELEMKGEESTVETVSKSMRKITGLKFSRSYTLIGTMVVLGLLSSAPAFAGSPTAPAPATAGTTTDPFKDLKGLERRFFFHEYDHDPLEKRLERIELLVFGAAQDGQNTDRLQRIRIAVVQRDKEAAQRLAEKNRALKTEPSPSVPKATAPTSSQQYPILQTLEWRALQKTYGGETLDQRLDRLETSLLGQPSPAMSYSDRIERLKKMIGVADPGGGFSPAPKTSLIPKGPAPRAGKRGQMISPFSTPYITPIPRSYDDDDDSTFEEDFNAQMSSDLRQMIDMMNRMNRMPGMRIPMNPGGGRGMMLPIPNSEGAAPYVVPNPPPKKPKIPPYADPNSI